MYVCILLVALSCCLVHSHIILLLIAGAIMEEESMFSYSLDSSNFDSFQHPTHQPAFLDQLTLTEEQMEQCGSDKQCAFDIAQTGDVEIGLATMNINQSNTMDQMILGRSRQSFTQT